MVDCDLGEGASLRGGSALMPKIGVSVEVPGHALKMVVTAKGEHQLLLAQEGGLMLDLEMILSESIKSWRTFLPCCGSSWMASMFSIFAGG